MPRDKAQSESGPPSSERKMPVLQGFVQPFQANASSQSTDTIRDAQSDTDGEEDEDDFENHDFEELTDIANGLCQHYASSGTRKVLVSLQILELDGRRQTNTVKKVEVRCDPNFLEPFWMMSVEVKDSTRRKGSYFSTSTPSFTPRCDDGVNKEVCSLFLRRCGVEDQHKELFLDFMQMRNLRFSLEGMQDDLTFFGNSSDINKEIADQIRAHLHSSGKLFKIFIAPRGALFKWEDGARNNTHTLPMRANLSIRPKGEGEGRVNPPSPLPLRA